MTLISLIVVLLLVGLALWAINELPFIDGRMKVIIRILIVVFVVLWLLSGFGLLDVGPTLRFHR